MAKELKEILSECMREATSIEELAERLASAGVVYAPAENEKLEIRNADPGGVSYIEREAVLELIQEAFHKTDVNGEEQMGVLTCHRIVREAPAADVVEVRHGKWLRYGQDDKQCSLCRAVNTNCIGNNFCHNCGARMDWKRSDDA